MARITIGNKFGGGDPGLQLNSLTCPKGLLGKVEGERWGQRGDAGRWWGREKVTSGEWALRCGDWELTGGEGRGGNGSRACYVMEPMLGAFTQVILSNPLWSEK